MHKPTTIFVAAIIVFATGTSAVGFSLAKDSRVAVRQPAVATTKPVHIAHIPWYCASTKQKIKAQALDDTAAGYYPGGYAAPSAGYQPQKSGYQAAATPADLADSTVILPAKLQPNELASAWQTLLTCPDGFKLDESLVLNKCSAALQKKLNGDQLPAESKEQYATCTKILSPDVWGAKISQKICDSFYLYQSDCAASQKSKHACQPLSKYLTTAGVAKTEIPKTQSDTIYLCTDVYPKS